jgi:hypothetical protein
MRFYGETIDGEPIAAWEHIYERCRGHKRWLLTIEPDSAARTISEQQTAYLHAVVYPTLAEAMHCSLWHAEVTLKQEPGKEWFVKEFCDKETGKVFTVILSKTTMSVASTTKWLENIWDWAEKRGIHIPLPNKSWRQVKADYQRKG